MTQLLESTRNYLKTSTRLGRRMSNYKLEAASSQSSLNEKIIGTANNSNNSHKRLSGLFNTDGRTKKNSFSEDQVPTGTGSAIHQTKTNLNTQDTIVPDEYDRINADHRRRNSRSSEGTRQSRRSDKSHLSSQDGTLNSSSSNNRSSRHHYRNRDHASAHMEHEVPRGRSPTLSMSNTVSTATSYNTRPSTTITTNTDPTSHRQGQSHVWRRNLLEESIMYSLKLGYAERRRSSSRHRSSRSSKSDSPRARKAREQALLAAATGRDILNRVPESAGRHAFDVETLHEEILDRSFAPPPLSAHTGTGQHQQHHHHQKQQQQQQQLQKASFRKEKNSPYQMEYNASMTNITQSFASFTLELPEHQVSHIITSSAIPDLFKIKTTMSGVQEQRPMSRRNSRTLSIGGGISPSPRVLTGGTTAGRSTPITLHQHLQQQQQHQQQGAGLHVENLVEEEENEDVDSPVSPTTATWVKSVFASLDEAKAPKHTAPLFQASNVRATAV
ncbi:hypothetical protein BG015_005156 [Linnemannia schmuckeri]|uniref:Uncharacterized protein n=1 Tax=Linnemannia schmuckeri TaxID=64567 RepID=A0A9P5R676_9FUNG|nr:hypothetical protein BG015_005156 [Linnemannia schmuckeri]